MAGLVLTIDDVHWHVQMVDVTRHASDWFVQFVALGPRTHTLFLRTPASPTSEDGFGRLLAHIREWLARNDPRPCAFIDVGER